MPKTRESMSYYPSKEAAKRANEPFIERMKREGRERSSISGMKIEGGRVLEIGKGEPTFVETENSPEQVKGAEVLAEEPRAIEKLIEILQTSGVEEEQIQQIQEAKKEKDGSGVLEIINKLPKRAKALALIGLSILGVGIFNQKAKARIDTCPVIQSLSSELDNAEKLVLSQEDEQYAEDMQNIDAFQTELEDKVNAKINEQAQEFVDTINDLKKQLENAQQTPGEADDSANAKSIDLTISRARRWQSNIEKNSELQAFNRTMEEIDEYQKNLTEQRAKEKKATGKAEININKRHLEVLKTAAHFEAVAFTEGKNLEKILTQILRENWGKDINLNTPLGGLQQIYNAITLIHYGPPSRKWQGSTSRHDAEYDQVYNSGLPQTDAIIARKMNNLGNITNIEFSGRISELVENLSVIYDKLNKGFADYYKEIEAKEFKTGDSGVDMTKEFARMKEFLAQYQSGEDFVQKVIVDRLQAELIK